MDSDTPTPDHIAAVYMNTLSLKSDPASWWAHKEITRLRAELAAAIKERDNARRTLCEEWAKDGLPFDWKGRRGPMGMADLLKWDCFKEAGGA